MAATTEANNSSSSSGMGAMEDWRKKSGLSCSFFIFAALNLAMVIVGGDAVYLCKIQPMIPIYLIGKLVIHDKNLIFIFKKFKSCSQNESK